MKFLKIFFAVFILAISSLSFAKAAFREPTSDLDFVSAPVTPLATGQIKIGSLNLSWLSVLGDLTTGYVGIGGDANNANSIPQEKLDIQGNINIHNQILLGGTSTAPSDGQVLHFTYDNPNGSPRLRWGGNYAFVSLISDVVNNNCDLNGICDGTETCGSCPGDCVPPAGEACEVATATNAPSSCDLDGWCEAAQGETYDTCKDCRGCENPGIGCNNNGICEDKLPNNQNEGWQSCPLDCVCSFRKYNPINVSGICGDGHLDPGEECDPPDNFSYVVPAMCATPGSNPDTCGLDCKLIPGIGWFPVLGPSTDLVDNSLGAPGPGVGGGCANSAPTGAPQCGGSCPNAGETCQDNNGGAAGGLCQCISSSACGGTYPACNGSCPTGQMCYNSSRDNACHCGVYTITDLSTSNQTASSIDLSWSAPLSYVNVTSYTVKRSTSLITQANFNSATTVLNPPTPQAPGTLQSMTVSGLSSNTTYYFAIESTDADGNVSTISNVPSAQTSGPDVTPPGGIATLHGTNLGTTVNLTWISPGDDGNTGTATLYDIRRNTLPITPVNFITSTQISNPPTPAIAGTLQSKTVSGLTNGLIYYFAMRTYDEVGNGSILSNVIGIEIGRNGGSFPAFNGSDYKNPFASLLDSIDLNLIDKAKAAGTCGNIWLPINCYLPWMEYSAPKCINDTWTRQCFKEK